MNFLVSWLLNSPQPLREMKSLHAIFLTVGILRAAGESPIVSSEFINENAPYPECHASTIAEVAPGKLVAAWFGGTKERNPDVGIWFARQESGHWEKAVEVANGVQSDAPRLPTWNPVLFRSPKGPLVLFYKVGPSPSQ